MSDPRIPSRDLIAEMRDTAIECYIRRLPQAAPEPGTSLYEILEASAMVWAAVIANSEDPERIKGALRAMLAADRQEMLDAEPNATENFYKPREDKRGRPVNRRELPPPGTAPNSRCIL